MGQKLSQDELARRPGTLPWEQIAALTPFGLVRDYATGDCIQFRAAPNPRLTVIISGRVRLSRTDRKGRRIETAILTEGEFFGIEQILPVMDGDHDVHADGNVRTLSFDAATTHRLIDDYPAFRMHLLSYTTDRLIALTRLLDCERRFPLNVRLAMYLSNRLNNATGEIRGSQLEHAQALGVSRNALGLSLQALAEQGIILINRNSISIPQPELLASWLAVHTDSV